MLAWHLVRNGKHEVTVVARGARLAQLQADKAILTASGDRAEVLVSAGLDTAVPYDLLLVPVKGNQVAKVLPDLRASAARAVMFMSVTFGSLHPMREAVGPGRFAYGFPKFPAIMKEGRLKDVKMRGPTIVTEARWAQLFNDAGIPSSVTPCDMDSYLRAHVAAATPILTLSYLAHTRGSGLSWAEARTHAQASVKPVPGFGCVGASEALKPLHRVHHISESSLASRPVHQPDICTESCKCAGPDRGLCHSAAPGPQHSPGWLQLDEQHPPGT